ncbi:MAG: gliding motility lipoprotein GldD [Bacteroidales bacterium]
MNTKHIYLNRLVLPFLTVFFIVSCTADYYPKPKGFFRIDLPEKEFRRFDTTFPYSFDYPVYAVIEPNDHAEAEPYWINIQFPAFHGTVHLSYKPIHGNLNEYLEDTRSMVMKHIPKATGIENRQFVNIEKDIYSLTYAISGTGAASPYQFYITDSLHHFIRGALYFNTIPNNDSLSPVIRFLMEDIDHLIETFEWK